MKKVFSKRLLKKIDKYEVISFDIFDTLIKRNCMNPIDIFEIVQSEYNKRNDNKIENFKELRINAEKKAREICELEDVTLNQIYEQINLPGKKEKLLNIEIEIEKEFCVVNRDIYDIYMYCKQENKKIICISDMYLDKVIINEILKKNGYDIELDNIYVSSNVGRTKRSGNLFKYVLKKNNIEKSNILHIGDSKRADFLIPKLNGIKSILIPRYIKKYKYLSSNNFPNTSNNILYSFINNNLKINDDEYYRIGFEILGPIIYSFCKWLHIQCKEKKIEKLFFCARDMQFTQRIYNEIFEDDAINNEYLYISRRSIEQPFLHLNNDFEDFLSTMTEKKLLIKDILRSKGIVIKDLEEKIEKYGLSSTIEYNSKSINNKDFKNFYNEVIKDEIKKFSEEQYKNFNAYMNTISFNKNTSAIIDLGWKGTIQFALNNIYKGNNIKGFYLGIEDKMYKELEGLVFGYIFSPNKNQDISKKIYSFRSLFEIFFSATHGTTVKYVKSDERNLPYMLAKYENPNVELIEKIQKGGYDFIKGFKRYNKYINDIYILNIVNDLTRIGTNPTYEQAVIFGDFKFDNMIEGNIAKPKKILFYIKNPKILKKDLLGSEWKVGFLKRLLRLPLPYYRIYYYFKKFK